MRRVDIREQPSVGSYGSSASGPSSRTRNPSSRPRPAARRDRCARERRRAALAIDCAQRLEPARRARHDRVDVSSDASAISRSSSAARDERQVAGERPATSSWRAASSARVDAAQRARAGYQIRNDGKLEGRVSRRIVGDDQDILVARRRQDRELSIDDARTAEEQRRLVDAAEPPGAAAGEDRCRNARSHRSTLSRRRPMSEPRIGRVLVASLHQSIADLLPTRLEFYENWLNVSGLREGTIGLAPLSAVLSFLRTEGDAYNSDHGARRRVRRRHGRSTTWRRSSGG